MYQHFITLFVFNTGWSFHTFWEVFPHQIGVIKLKMFIVKVSISDWKKLFSWCKILGSTVCILRFFLMQNPWEYCMYSKICNADNQPSWPKCVQFSRRVEKNVGNVSKFGSPRMSLFLPKIIVVDCIEKMSEEIPDRLGSTAYLLNLMKAFCTHCCIQYYWLQVSAFWTQNTIREWEQISPKKNKTKPHCFSPRNLRAEKKP